MHKWEHMTDKSKSVSVKVRLAQVFAREGEPKSAILPEIRALSEKDLLDFQSWFEAAGFPTTMSPSA